MSSIEAILFDVDGTLNDTRQVIYGALEHAFKQHGLASPSREALAPYIHHHRAVHQAFGGDISEQDFFDSYFEKAFATLNQAPSYPEAEAVLTELAEDGYRLGVASGAVYLPDYFTRTKFDRFFEVVVGPDDVTKSKPDPESINLAVRRFELAPENVAMVGDLATDVQAAKAAHLGAVIGITHGFGTLASLKEAGADYIVDSLSDLPVLLETLE